MGFLRNLLSGPEDDFKKLTPQYFVEQKIRLSKDDYITWLERQYSYYTASMMPAMERNGVVPQYMTDGVNLIREELRQVGISTQSVEDLYSDRS